MKVPNWRSTHWGVMPGKCSEHSLLDLGTLEAWRRSGSGKPYYVAVAACEDRLSGPSVNVSK